MRVLASLIRLAEQAFLVIISLLKAKGLGVGRVVNQHTLVVVWANDTLVMHVMLQS